MRWTEEEYAAYEARRGKDTSSDPPSAAHLPHQQSRHCLPAGATSRGASYGCQPRAAAASAMRSSGGASEGKASKYHNQRVEIDGKKFDSKHEAEVYGELMLRQRAGELKLVLRQVPFDLPGGIRYIADFVTMDHAGSIEVIDAKSEITRKNRVYINKKKQMRSEWGIEVKEV